jgi:uncharacterized protein (DUF697 family)
MSTDEERREVAVAERAEVWRPAEEAVEAVEVNHNQHALSPPTITTPPPTPTAPAVPTAPIQPITQPSNPRKKSAGIIWIFAALGAGVALVTTAIPGTSLMLLALEIIMVILIARTYNQKLGMDELGPLAIGILLAGLVLKLVVTELIYFIPCLNSVVAAGFVLVIGYAGRHYIEVKSAQ